jgi:hypothetical protein
VTKYACAAATSGFPYVSVYRNKVASEAREFEVGYRDTVNDAGDLLKILKHWDVECRTGGNRLVDWLLEGGEIFIPKHLHEVPRIPKLPAVFVSEVLETRSVFLHMRRPATQPGFRVYKKDVENALWRLWKKHFSRNLFQIRS